MISELSVSARFVKVLTPTFGQGIICFIVALFILLISQGHQVLSLMGIETAALDAFSNIYHSRVDHLLTSQVASSTALVAFWATIGLIAYLLCWSAYNMLIEARNEVTLKTQYTNRGRWHGPFLTVGLKTLGAIFLLVAVLLLKPGLALWLAFAAPLFFSPVLMDYVLFAAAVVGLAAQLYLVLVGITLTFSRWYSKESFTERY